MNTQTITIDSLLVVDLKRHARTDTFDGQLRSMNRFYFRNAFRSDAVSGVLIGFTRDVGMHSGGWWKNPDYERCWHLSMSFFDPWTLASAPRNVKLTRVYLDVFFGENKKLIWTEPPATVMGQKKSTWHYRLFADEHWQPLKPRGEVYTKRFMPKNWRSFSEVQADLQKLEKWSHL